MSIAGIRSNRGDGYQTLVAFDWALTVLSDPNCLWLEVDSISYSVDDVVVGKIDGTLIACQCKKNQIDFSTWKCTDLKDELVKAISLLNTNNKAEVRFYSRNNFGLIAKLREHSTTQNDEKSYQNSLTPELQKIDLFLFDLLKHITPIFSSFDFLSRINFVTTDNFDRMQELLIERLRNIASNPDAAFNALWLKIDQIGARMERSSSSLSSYQLTKDDLTEIISNVGSILVPQMDITRIRTTFATTSAIGRAWRRDVGGQCFVSPILVELIAAVDSKKSSILLTGLPGSGKTCVMLSLLEELEARAKTSSNIVPLFIQSREFSEITSVKDRQAKGLSPDWVAETARLAETVYVVIIIDSLDVLSIARDHEVLSYFLAQLDRLRLVPNVCVITACREFDRRYDRRIAERKWDCEIKCRPLDWDVEIVPLLNKLGVKTDLVDTLTRDLISNPRQLSMFVELAQKVDSFNIVTSQELAQLYLNLFVRDNNLLGDKAIKAIEDIATAMLKSRSLFVSYQRFDASQDILRGLSSLNVIQENSDGRLTFCHQTLLDVLVISGAMRNHMTLSKFILDLPSVPFVRPTIRSFVTLLARSDRREFRKQLHPVLTGSIAFHIRRLVAETFAEQNPQDDDWPLIRELREKHRDVFQVIYSSTAIEWHHFWIKFLVSDLKLKQDAEGMRMHIYRVSQWLNKDSSRIINLWTEALSFDWIDGNAIADRILFSLLDLNPINIKSVGPLLELLLNKSDVKLHYLGKVVARCVDAGVADDHLLWRYISRDFKEGDLLNLNFLDKLRCHAADFDDKTNYFFKQRMVQSTALLDLALSSIERWSNVLRSKYDYPLSGYQFGFLSETTYRFIHSQQAISSINSMNILFDAVEASIIQHANQDSEWWQNNRERLCSNKEGAIIYFSILACIKSPATNLHSIGLILCDENLLQSRLSFELGTLIKTAFFMLDNSTQDAVLANILSLRTGLIVDKYFDRWLLKLQAELISAIPSYLRLPLTQTMLDDYEKGFGALIRLPEILSRGGMVSPPFTHDVFIHLSDAAVLRLLAHYSDYKNHLDEFLVGGKHQVGIELREASSRHPIKFSTFLYRNWQEISDFYRDEIIEGVSTYLEYRYGNLQNPSSWNAIEEPVASVFSAQILDELERHYLYWQLRPSTAKALQACAYNISDENNVTRLIFLSLGFLGFDETEKFLGNNNYDLIFKGINMAKGNVAQALMILASNMHDQGIQFPELLAPTLLRFASDKQPAVRALILNRLAYFQSKDFDLGWDLFYRAMEDADGLWESAEPCLYYAYENHFDIVKPLLARLRKEGVGKDLETWGRISALATMSKKIEFTEFLNDLKLLDKPEAYYGASVVWTNIKNFQKHPNQSYLGLMVTTKHSEVVRLVIDNFFRNDTPIISVPNDLIKQCFDVLKVQSNQENAFLSLFGFHDWLNVTSQIAPEKALTVIEVYLDFLCKCQTGSLYDHNNCLTQMMTRLFAEAEVREETDNGAMLRRVIIVQDTLLALGVNGVEDWLKAAERP